MNPETFEIKEFDSVQKAKAKGFTVPLTRKEFGMLSEKTRAERRIWLKSKGWQDPKEHNAMVKNRNAKKASRKRVKADTLKMRKKARALA